MTTTKRTELPPMMKRVFLSLLSCAIARNIFLSAYAFSTSSSIVSHRAREQISSLYSSSQVNGDANTGMSKLEMAGVKRFTISYDKLCKSCPTRLQPRVDTLTEMILGLPEKERDELMENVARRLKEEVQGSGVRSPEEVYDFQTAGVQVEPEKPKKAKQQNKLNNGAKSKSNEPATVKSCVDPNAKLLQKMDKARVKFESNKTKAARARRLLAVTNALLTRNAHANEPTIYSVANPVDNAWYHDIDELKQLSREELKMERLKFSVQKAKYESKVAKGRLKLYGASIALADAKKDQQAAVVQ